MGGRAWVSGGVIVAAAFLGSVQLHAGDWARSLEVGGGLAAVTAVAVGLRSASALRTMVFVDLLFAGYAAGAHGGWYPAVTVALVCVVPGAVLLGCNRWPWLRPAAPWLRWGQPTSGVVRLAMVTVVVSAAALTGWALATHPVPSPYYQGLQPMPLWLAVLGVLGGAIVNAIWEEALFRGVVLTELAANWGIWPAVVIQALATGFAHLNGFPSGWVGMAMTATWGLVLGIVRVRTGGVGIPYVIHVFADATIGVLAALLLL
ncbi:CPBP family intramembrane metalloprotease [Nocardia terpenica]|uniref:CPBP family intramembrane metalloprotease n=2 Tax=Nocardia terpenica TaxID=455432 RepID=A0A291RX09_9NOCA|nr:CPBP family intramembrane metalloprotease [Nocardia terpenica]